MNATTHREFKDRLFEQFARVGKALASPKRLEIVDLLAQGERTVEEIARETAMSVASASQHLQVLKAARMVEVRRERLLDGEAAQGAAERAKALSDPTRLTLAEALREGEELCVCDLSWIVGRSQNLVSHHLGMLRSRGLVRSRRDGKMVMYSLTPIGRSLLGVVAGDPVGDPA